MDDGGSPIIIVMAIIMSILVLVLLVLLVFMKDEINKKFQKLKDSHFSLDNKDVTEKEILSMVNEGHEQGVLHEQEAEMINNILEFDEKEAKDIMTHRTNIIALDANMSFCDAIDVMGQTSKSRFPVYDNDIDNIIGILHIKDALDFCHRNEVFRTSLKDIPNLISDVKFIPETRKINVLFRKMQLEKIHMVVVVDEYGQTSGIVAMEDILEEIVGNIEDEHDLEEHHIEKISKDSYVIDGMTSIEELKEILDIPSDRIEFDTLNGMLVSLIDKVPNDGENFTVDAYGYNFCANLIEDKTIKKVTVTKKNNVA
ncbi:hemolysin family protein [Lachnobacterium bovis]|uniref:Putative hemolysin n=1 Tax=Lachnobacterium bovis TaxID=140626 RepID=A0A1H9PTP2_9FIRM|nr:hemolysin family protein [Lachnobacterium bovis]SER51205.1 putative hemolysin [Lachnobacterium bovis]